MSASIRLLLALVALAVVGTATDEVWTPEDLLAAPPEGEESLTHQCSLASRIRVAFQCSADGEYTRVQRGSAAERDAHNFVFDARR